MNILFFLPVLWASKVEEGRWGRDDRAVFFEHLVTRFATLAQNHWFFTTASPLFLLLTEDAAGLLG